jgi:excisionase family DNA binding protein
MQTIYNPTQTAVEITGDHSPHPVYANVDVVDALGGPETAYHRIKRWQNAGLMPRMGSRAWPLTLRDLRLAQANEKLGRRHWQFLQPQGEMTRQSTGYDFVSGYGYITDEEIVIVDESDRPIWRIVKLPAENVDVDGTEFDQGEIEQQPKFLSTAEAAERMGMTTSGVRRLILTGRLPARKLGRDWIIQPADLRTVKKSNAGRPRKPK